MAGLFKINIDFKVDQVAATDYYWANYFNAWEQYETVWKQYYPNGDKGKDCDNDYYELEKCEQKYLWSSARSKIEVTYKDSKTPIIVK